MVVEQKTKQHIVFFEKNMCQNIRGKANFHDLVGASVLVVVFCFDKVSHEKGLAKVSYVI